MHTTEGTEKFSTQRLKREHGQIIVFISRDLCTERGERKISILGVLFNIIFEFTFSTARNRKTGVFY